MYIVQYGEKPLSVQQRFHISERTRLRLKESYGTNQYAPVHNINTHISYVYLWPFVVSKLKALGMRWLRKEERGWGQK
jgi:hypothetical protein